MSPLVAGTMPAKSWHGGRRGPYRGAVSIGGRRLGVHSTMRAAALLPGIGGLFRGAQPVPGPKAPALLSRYAASPIRYGQPRGDRVLTHLGSPRG